MFIEINVVFEKISSLSASSEPDKKFIEMVRLAL